MLLRLNRPGVVGICSQLRLATAIRRLWVKSPGHNHFEGVNQVMMTIIRVGRRIFSTAVDLGFVNDQYRGCELWPREGLGPRLLRRRRRLKVVGGPRRRLCCRPLRITKRRLYIGKASFPPSRVRLKEGGFGETPNQRAQAESRTRR